MRSVRFLIIVLAVVLASCAPTALSPTPPATDPPAASPSRSTPAISDTELAEAVAFRELRGLRADAEWAREVAGNPAAVTTFGVPLLPAEEAELSSRPREFHDLAPVVQEYAAAHPGDFGGMYLDQVSGRIVVMFTGDLASHEAALARVVHPAATLELRLTPIAERDLDALMERIANESEELSAAGIFVLAAGRNDTARTVDLELSTEREDAVGFLVARYGPTVTARIVDPTGALLKPRGTIVGRVIDAGGRGVSAMLDLDPLFGEIPLDAVGRGTEEDGGFRLERQLAGLWRITATSNDGASGSVEVDVPAGGTVSVEIVVTAGA